MFSIRQCKVTLVGQFIEKMPQIRGFVNMYGLIESNYCSKPARRPENVLLIPRLDIGSSSINVNSSIVFKLTMFKVVLP